jgi:hypothetical protein
MTTTAFDRKTLRSMYLFVVDTFATDLNELTQKGRGVEPAEIKRHLRELERAGLVVGTHVNGERKVTYQSNFDLGSGDKRADAVKAFQAVYGNRGPIERQARVGATGPKYTEQQIQLAIKARLGGASWKTIGNDLGIKATAYLSKRLTPLVEAQKAGKALAKSETTPAAKKVPATVKKAASKKAAAKRQPAKRTVRVKAVAA